MHPRTQYMPFAEELGVVPTEKYAHQPELQGHARKVMEHFGLYENALFGTMVRVSPSVNQSVSQVGRQSGSRSVM